METHESLLLIFISGLFGGATVLTGRIIWDWLSKKNNPRAYLERDYKKMIRKTLNKADWLKNAHEKTDENGIPLWYVPREYVTILKSLNKI